MQPIARGTAVKAVNATAAIPLSALAGRVAAVMAGRLPQGGTLRRERRFQYVHVLQANPI